MVESLQFDMLLLCLQLLHHLLELHFLLLQDLVQTLQLLYANTQTQLFESIHVGIVTEQVLLHINIVNQLKYELDKKKKEQWEEFSNAKVLKTKRFIS